VHYESGQISVSCRLELMLRSLTFSFVYISALARIAFGAQSFTSDFHQFFHHNNSESLLSSLSLVFLSCKLSLNSYTPWPWTRGKAAVPSLAATKPSILRVQPARYKLNRLQGHSRHSPSPTAAVRRLQTHFPISCHPELRTHPRLESP
jgi:hypothetical protein